MSKLNAVINAIESLEKAENALLEARRAFQNTEVFKFSSSNTEYDILDEIYEEVSDSVRILETRILAKLEDKAMNKIKESNE